MGVDLGARQRGVAQEFLHAPQIGTALQQMRGSRMPQTVGPGVGHSRYRGEPGVDNPPRGSRVKTPAAGADEERGAAASYCDGEAAGLPPGVNGPHGGRSHRHRPFPATLAQHPDRAALDVDVVDIKTA
jgi:hypothetical protein